MGGSVKHCAAGFLTLLSAALFFACGDGPYQGGRCATTDHCQSEDQNVPGTICVDEHCVCGEPGKVICCARGEEEPSCFLECRECSECAEGTLECSGYPEPSGGCESDAECPGPPDPRCGAGRCVDGACEVEITRGPIASQRRGDCKVEECTADGRVVSVAAYDAYDDGNQCTLDVCEIDRPRNLVLEDVTCPDSGGGRCHAGECLQCYGGDRDMCPAGLACDGVWCVPLHCVNGVRDAGLGETGFDCGGPCRPCQPSERCAAATDCVSGVCTNGSCQIPTCSDNVKNGTETGIDCGAPSCPRCAPGRGCKTGADCTSGVCWRGLCEPPTCSDGVKNGDEAGVDCGGEGCSADCPG
ncbi:hypothetical protein SOCEGT47_043760 [Sorangium cellulosum]|uniref:Tryptophan synthase alpha chain n=1 Tax=Sorangium cellulosum TaxID=56 RepID=A0A4P2Q488_SORCE|nr:hypothetical protein [Sorangium cellulosum]AUX23846.1 hypothetical protein SOCEGT47_043760 [Sorangium cellulosum]